MKLLPLTSYDCLIMREDRSCFDLVLTTNHDGIFDLTKLEPDEYLVIIYNRTKEKQDEHRQGNK